MDMQLLIVMLCVAAAVGYFVRRMYRSVKSGTCSCCEGGGRRDKSGCGCGGTEPRRAVITKFSSTAAGQSPRHAGDTKAKTLAVEGMMCGNCEAHVTKALEALDGVLSVRADHATGTVSVQLSRDISDAEWAKALSDAGYAFRGVVL